MVLLLFVAKQKHCVRKHERPYNSFISDATANGLILMKLPETRVQMRKCLLPEGRDMGLPLNGETIFVDRVRLKTHGSSVIIMPEMEQTDWSAEQKSDEILFNCSP